jgi:adenylate cyclase
MLNIRSLSPRLHRILSGVVSRAMDEGVSGRLSESFRETERSGLMLASGVRVGALAAMTLAFLVTQSFTGSGAVVLYAMAAGLGLVGLLQLEALRRWPEFSWTKYVFVVFDCVFLTGFLLFRHALSEDLPPPTVAVKEGALIFYIPFLVQSAFSYSPRFILWTGGWITAGWTTVVVAAALAPETQFVLPADAQGWDAYGNPSYLPLIKVTYDFVCFGAVLAGLAVAVWRSRELVKAAAVSEKARANLARHFSPRVLDELSSREQPFGAVRRQSAAILFADIRGFTTRCETMEPEEAIAFLRDFHARMEDVIFRHGGTLDKILGDGLLAVFGIPDRGTGDAGDALACAYDMAENVRRWNEEREAQGLFPVHIGIGLHFGPVMTGDVGSERLMTFTVVGDTVNVASRLQSLSKEIGTILVASEALVDAVREELKHDAQLVDELTRIGPRQLRGRESETVVYALQLDAGSTTA